MSKGGGFHPPPALLGLKVYHGPIFQNLVFCFIWKIITPKCKFKISVEMVKPFGCTKQFCVLQLPISYCARLIMVMGMYVFINIFVILNGTLFSCNIWLKLWEIWAFLWYQMQNLLKFEKNWKLDWAPSKTLPLVLQPCTKFIGTHAVIIITTFIIKIYMCTKWHVWFNIHVLSMRPPPPSPIKQCWYTHVSYSFAVQYPWQHWSWGAGNRVLITKCPNSFVQDCSNQIFTFCKE